MKKFNAEKGRIIKEGAGEDEEAALRSLFVTQAEDELEAFEKEKEEEVENEYGKKVPQKTVLQGWGSWAGEGVDNTRHEQRVKRIEEARKKKIEEMKAKR